MRWYGRVVRLFVLGVVSLAAWLPFSLTEAATYPSKPITIIIPFSPGGTTDLTARTVSPIMAEHLGVTLIPQNMVGASGGIGADFVSKANPDGYTLMFMPETTALFQVMGISNLSVNDFIPIMVFTMGIPTITVPIDAKWKTAAEFLEDAAKRPKAITIGSSGPATSADISMILLERYANAQFTAVPYAGGGPAVLATLGKTVDANFQSISEVIEHVRAGKLKVLATFTNERLSFLPDVPALGEAVPGIRKHLPWGPWWGLAAPKGTPPDVVAKLREAAGKASQDKRYIEKMNSMMVSRIDLEGTKLNEFLKRWTSVTTWLLYEGGRAKTSPEKFNIPRP